MVLFCFEWTDEATRVCCGIKALRDLDAPSESLGLCGVAAHPKLRDECMSRSSTDSKDGMTWTSPSLESASAIYHADLFYPHTWEHMLDRLQPRTETQRSDAPKCPFTTLHRWLLFRSVGMSSISPITPLMPPYPPLTIEFVCDPSVSCATLQPSQKPTCHPKPALTSEVM